MDLTRWRERYGALSRPARDLALSGALLLFGVLVMPLLIWLAGNRVLGGYVHAQNAHAGPIALLGDFLLGLVYGSAVFWAVALGPVALVFGIRLFVALVRALP